MHLVIIDGYGFIFRAYYALRKLTCPNGQEIGAIYGFTKMLMQLLAEFHASHIVIAYDSGHKNFRHKLYEKYKANRVSPPQDLKTQFPLMRDVNTALGIPSIEVPGYEADDIIATLTKLALNRDADITIVSSDKDLAQLMNNKVKIYDPIKSHFLTEKYILEKFGVHPTQITDTFALIGDASDNIPGVPGIGPKTAANLINEYKTIENIYLNLENISNLRHRKLLEDNKEIVSLSKQLIMLDYDVPLPNNLDELSVQELNTENLLSFLHKYNFKSILGKVEKHKALFARNLLFAESLELKFTHEQHKITFPESNK